MPQQQLTARREVYLAPRKRRPVTRSSLKGTLLESIFTPTGLIAKQVQMGSFADSNAPFYFSLPQEKEKQQHVLHTLRDDLIDGRNPTFDAVAASGFFALQACQRAKRPIRSDQIASSLRFAAALHRASFGPWKISQEVAHERSGLAKLGWLGLGPVFVDQFYEAYADALECGSPYTSNAVARAALTVCLEEICRCRNSYLNVSEVFHGLEIHLRPMLSMALTAFQQPAPERDLKGYAARKTDPTKFRMVVGQAQVEAEFAPKIWVSISAAGQKPLTLTMPGFGMLCSTLLCGYSEAAKQSPVVCLTKPGADSPLHKLQIANHDWLLHSNTLVQLQRAILKLFDDQGYQRRMRHLELTCGAL